MPPTGERLEIEILTSRSERGRWKSTRQGNSLTAYSTVSPVLNGEDEETGRKVLRLVLTQLGFRWQVSLGVRRPRREGKTQKTISPYRRRCQHDDTCWLCGPWEYGPAHGAERTQGRLRAPRL